MYNDFYTLVKDKFIKEKDLFVFILCINTLKLGKSII